MTGWGLMEHSPGALGHRFILLPLPFAPCHSSLPLYPDYLLSSMRRPSAARPCPLSLNVFQAAFFALRMIPLITA